MAMWMRSELLSELAVSTDKGSQTSAFLTACPSPQSRSPQSTPRTLSDACSIEDCSGPACLVSVHFAAQTPCGPVCRVDVTCANAPGMACRVVRAIASMQLELMHLKSAVDGKVLLMALMVRQPKGVPIQWQSVASAVRTAAQQHASASGPWACSAPEKSDHPGSQVCAACPRSLISSTAAKQHHFVGSARRNACRTHYAICLKRIVPLVAHASWRAHPKTLHCARRCCSST